MNGFDGAGELLYSLTKRVIEEGHHDNCLAEGEDMLLAGDCDFYVVTPIEWEILLWRCRN